MSKPPVISSNAVEVERRDMLHLESKNWNESAQ